MKESVKKWLQEQMPEADEAMFEDIYSEYKETSNRLLGELKEKFAASAPFDVTDKIAHTLKGNALMVGDTELFDVVQAWRTNLKDGNLDACKTGMPEIERLVGIL